MAQNPSPENVGNALVVLAGLTLGAVAGVCSGGTAFLPALGGLLGFASGMAGNQGQGWIKGLVDARPPGPDEVFRNHHLRTLITEAAAQVVAEVVAGEVAPSGTLLAAQKGIAAALDRALGDPHSPLLQLSEWRLADRLTEFVQQQGKVKTLTLELWSDLLGDLPADLWPGERSTLAEALHERFAHALWGLVKRDAATDGQAFAAIEVLYLSRILEATEGVAQRPDPTPILAHVAELITTLDAEQKKLLRGLLQGNSHIIGLLDRIEEKLDRVVLASSLQRYYQALLTEFADHDNVSLPVSTPEGKDETEEAIKIRALFVPPRCSKEYLKPAHVDAAVSKGETLGVPLLPLLEPPGTRIVLLGDPGMGKSTVLQYLIATLAEGLVPVGAPDLRHAVPLPFVLRVLARSLPDDAAQWNWDALLDAFCRWNPGAESHGSLAGPLIGDRFAFRTLLEEGRAFFLIDGLDEVGDRARRLAMNRVLWEGFSRHPRARWLITSRPVGYEQAELHQRWVYYTGMGDPVEFDEPPTRGQIADSAPKAERLYLAPFDDEQQHLFARHWYVARMNASTGQQRAVQFIAAVHQHSHLRVIGRIPNLLYLLALLYRHRKHLPNGRALVYAAISEAYLHNIPDVRQLIQKGTAFDRPLQKKESLLAIVGLKMQQQRASLKKGEDNDTLVSRAQLEEWLRPHFTDDAELVEFLEHVARHSGLLLPRGEDVYGFAHLSFQEYYAACHLQQDFDRILAAKSGTGGGLRRRSAPAAEEHEERRFAEYAVLPAWHEPLLFLVEKLSGSAPYTERLIEWMFPQFADDPAKGEQWMPFPAAQLLATLSVDPEVALDLEQREAIWQKLWAADCAAWSHQWMIASSLVVAGSPLQTDVLQAAASLNPSRLRLSNCPGLGDLTPLAGLTGLQKLSLMGCTGLGDLTPLARLTALEWLDLDDCMGLSDLSPLAGLTNLQALGVKGWKRLGDLSPLAGLTRLRMLNFSLCTGLSDLTPLAGLTGLQDLRLIDCTGLGNLTPLAGLRRVRELFLSGCKGLGDLTPLAGLIGLRSLDLHGCKGLGDLTPLAGLAGLQNLELGGCTGLGDLTPLAGLTGLKNLHLRGCSALSQEEIEKLRKALPNTQISG